MKSSQTVLLVFPHQLFLNHPGFAYKPSLVALIEDDLFFGDSVHQLAFHQQKLWFHRATMKRYAENLRQTGYAVDYVQHRSRNENLEQYFAKLKRSEVESIVLADPHDYLLEKRVSLFAKQYDLKVTSIDTPMFLNSQKDNQEYREGKKRWFMSDFYKFQRKKLGLLMDGETPAGGKWSFDGENRKKVPKAMLGDIPQLGKPIHDEIDCAARNYVQSNYSDNPGNLVELFFPTSHEGAAEWLDDFLRNRFTLFGDYEDAIVQGQNWLWHSVLTPMLNVGLLTPEYVVSKAIDYAQRNEVPLNALEGFVRQIIGWREFMRATYQDLGTQMRTTNHWQHHRPIPRCFYDGTTGIEPVDNVIRRVLDTGYCHHIERLMVLGGFMFLCEFSPDDIYAWFMEMFVDSYDWVMVPNVYAMSQHADGGLITTKPYFSGSSYIRKMSHYSKGSWTKIWDGLYWRWIWNHRIELAKNPRWAMMCAMARKMDPAKRQSHLDIAEKYLAD